METESRQHFVSCFVSDRDSHFAIYAYADKPALALEQHQVQPISESMTNFEEWMKVTESSQFKWVEDEIYRLNGRGAMYFTGGEDGVYMRIQKDGVLEAGGRQFMIDMFSGSEPQPLIKAGKPSKVNPKADKPSVLKEIRDSRTAPRLNHLKVQRKIKTRQNFN